MKDDKCYVIYGIDGNGEEVFIEGVYADKNDAYKMMWEINGEYAPTSFDLRICNDCNSNIIFGERRYACKECEYDLCKDCAYDCDIDTLKLNHLSVDGCNLILHEDEHFDENGNCIKELNYIRNNAGYYKLKEIIIK